MNCRQVRKHLDDLLVTGPGQPVPPEVADHLAVCPSCAQEHESAMQTLASLQPSCKLHASSHLKERIMSQIIAIPVSKERPPEANPWHFSLWKPLLAAAVAAALLAVASFHNWFGPAQPSGSRVALSLLSQAWAAEETLFTKAGIIHIVNEIIVKPVSNPDLARMRWFPIISLDATGKPRFHQLALPAQPGEGFVVGDQAWYDSATGRFARLLTVEGKPVFATAYDGAALYSLGMKPDSTSGVLVTTVTENFKPPRSPAEFLGITAGFPSALEEKDKSTVLESTEVTLGDGAIGQVVKVGFPGGPEPTAAGYMAFTIRKDDNTIAQIEWVGGGHSLLVIRRAKSEVVEKPEVGWDLAGIKSPVSPSPVAANVGIAPDMVLQDVDVQHMVKKADFQTYVFASDPSWASERRITDVLDVASPPHRMFITSYRVKDGRHVVLVQSYTYNTLLAAKVKTGRVVYESPKGFKVWSGPFDKWLANILIRSARAMTKDAPAEDRTGYMIETPAGTFPALAINGQVSTEELRALIDSLVPAKGAIKK